MIRECINCKHSRGLGSDVWCGHEPKGKESYMLETDCEYFEPFDDEMESIHTVQFRGEIMTDTQRFELKSWHFHDLRGIIYDNLEKKELCLSIYEIVDLLNKVTQQQYGLQNLKNDIIKKIDEVIENE